MDRAITLAIQIGIKSGDQLDGQRRAGLKFLLKITSSYGLDALDNPNGQRDLSASACLYLRVLLETSCLLGRKHHASAGSLALTRRRRSRNLSGSSKCGVWADCSNQTSCLLGASR